MTPPSDRNVLLGALLEHLGNIQAQALLARLDQLFVRDSGNIHTPEVGFDRNQAPVAHARYDRRRHDVNEIQRQTLRGGVSNAEGKQS